VRCKSIYSAYKGVFSIKASPRTLTEQGKQGKAAKVRVKPFFTIKNMRKFICIAATAATFAACGGKEEEVNYLTSIESVREHIKGDWYNDLGRKYTYLDSTYIYSYEYENISCDSGNYSCENFKTITVIDTAPYAIKQDGDAFYVEKTTTIVSYVGSPFGECLCLDDIQYGSNKNKVVSLDNEKLVYYTVFDFGTVAIPFTLTRIKSQQLLTP
jgi:hypothetical protein